MPFPDESDQLSAAFSLMSTLGKNSETGVLVPDPTVVKKARDSAVSQLCGTTAEKDGRVRKRPAAQNAAAGDKPKSAHPSQSSDPSSLEAEDSPTLSWTPGASQPRSPEANEPRIPEAQQPRAPEASRARTPESSQPRTPEPRRPRLPEACRRDNTRIFEGMRSDLGDSSVSAKPGAATLKMLEGLRWDDSDDDQEGLW